MTESKDIIPRDPADLGNDADAGTIDGSSRQTLAARGRYRRAMLARVQRKSLAIRAGKRQSLAVRGKRKALAG